MDALILQSYETYAKQKTTLLLKHINEDEIVDTTNASIKIHYALPFLFMQHGFQVEANHSLNYIQKNFFTGKEILENVSEDITEITSLIGIASHRLGRFDISFNLHQQLRKFYHAEEGAFTAKAPSESVQAVLDFTATTSLGHFFLNLGNLDKAKRAGNFLHRMLSLQTQLNEIFYLRLEEKGKLITHFEENAKYHYVISTHKSEQNFSSIGNAAYFLGKLFLATHDENYLHYAQAFQEFAKEAIEPFAECALSAALLANITKESRYIDKTLTILDQLIKSQTKKEESKIDYEKTALNAIALKEIVTLLTVI